MKNKKECKIVEDLLFGYKDESLNSESKKFVEEHLKNCGTCQDVLKEIEGYDDSTEINAEKEFDYLKRIHNKMNIKNKIVIIISILLSIIVVFNVIVLINYRLKAGIIQIYLTENVNGEEMKSIENEIRTIDEKAKITFISEEDELNRMKEKLGENSYLIEGYENNPFPASYVVKSSYSNIRKIKNSMLSKTCVKTIIDSVEKNPYDVFIESILK